MNNYNNKNSKQEIDKISEKIIEWLKEEGMYKETIKNKDTDEKFYFAIVARNPNAPNGSFFVAQPKIRNDLIVATLTLELIGGLFEKLKKMPPQAKTDFWASFKLGIVFATPTFFIRPNEDAPKSIEFRREIYHDGLSKDKLMEAIRDLYRCLLYSNLKFIQLGGQSNDETLMFG
ncbi:MAG: DUF2299 domain-containing protein [Candidatus Methanoperedens sp.]|nr:DUF2299 domain-containing protein [Candidatus Methanoperedens sp.]